MEIEKTIKYLRNCATLGDSPIMDGFAVIVEKKKLNDAADALSTLQAENARLRDDLEKVKAERDAAVDYLRGQCRYCKKYITCPTRRGPHDNCWKWRGPQKEN